MFFLITTILEIIIEKKETNAIVPIKALAINEKPIINKLKGVIGIDNTKLRYVIPNLALFLIGVLSNDVFSELPSSFNRSRTNSTTIGETKSDRPMNK